MTASAVCPTGGVGARGSPQNIHRRGRSRGGQLDSSGAPLDHHLRRDFAPCDDLRSPDRPRRLRTPPASAPSRLGTLGEQNPALARGCARARVCMRSAPPASGPRPRSPTRGRGRRRPGATSRTAPWSSSPSQRARTPRATSTLLLVWLGRCGVSAQSVESARVARAPFYPSSSVRGAAQLGPLSIRIRARKGLFGTSRPVLVRILTRIGAICIAHGGPSAPGPIWGSELSTGLRSVTEGEGRRKRPTRISVLAS